MNRRDFFKRASGTAVGAAVIAAAPLSLLADEKKDSRVVLMGATVNGNITMHGREGITITGCIVNAPSGPGIRIEHA